MDIPLLFDWIFIPKCSPNNKSVMEGCQFNLYFKDRLPFIHIQDGDLKEGEIKTVNQIQSLHTTIPEAYEWARLVGGNLSELSSCPFFDNWTNVAFHAKNSVSSNFLPKKICLSAPSIQIRWEGASLSPPPPGSYPLNHSVLLNLWSVVFEKTALTRQTKGHKSFSFIWCPWSIRPSTVVRRR